MAHPKDASMLNPDIVLRGLEVLDQPTCGVTSIIIHILLELKATALIRSIKSTENRKTQAQRILCNKKEAAPKVSTRTMAPTDLPVNLELTVAETLELPRWSAHSKSVDPQTIYKKKLTAAVETTEETSIV